MTLVIERTNKVAVERRFFLYMAVAIFITVVAGFGSDVVVHHVWFTDFPWQVHGHAIVFSSWIVLYLVQNWIVADGRNILLHRRLGWIGAAIATVMVPLGIVGTIVAISRGSVAGIFPLGLFLAMNTLGMLGFGALTFAAIRLRSNAGWHKRLMLCGTILVIGPAFGRLQALAPLGDFAPFAVIAAMLLYIAAGMIFDVVTLRRIHPAYWWGAATLALMQLLAGPIGFSAPIVNFAEGLTR